ncbi:hypothetical protein [Turneriella parva]|uniref:Uncharacterized protein n=1 Tax=Turneriella parva (strain ATCC BAA-1111 / DSM 21527 / NCTC 11395 / H) TaxID=869212 RepID=I4BBP0_TURPD|nr:hypothetical protein [Turneriella parva]AFM14697.1 hypothetical protein Turpa_4063 [Turneriella parva DSM 21527]
MPHSLFERFSLELEDGERPVLKSHACRKSGPLPQICAHAPVNNLQILYTGIQDIEVGLAGETFRGEATGQNCVSVTFRPNLRITLKDGTLLLPQKAGEAALSRVTYFNLHKEDLTTLRFLRTTADRRLFIEAVGQPDLLLQIAAENADSDPNLSAAAYACAINTIAAAQNMSAKDAIAFVSFIKACHHRSDTQAFARALENFRRLDQTGVGALELAFLLRDQRADKKLIEAIITESSARLLQRKPRDASLRLLATLEFIIENDMPTPQPSKLLWQTYLAASAERAVSVLRRVFLKARELNADRDTLEMIYKTWRGFAESDRRSGIKRLPTVRQLPGNSNAADLPVKEALDERGGDAG